MRPLAAVAAILAIPVAAPAEVPGIEVSNSIVDHTVITSDDAGRYPALFAYTGRTKASATIPGPVRSDAFAPAARLSRNELLPGIADDATLNWFAAARAVPAWVDVQDTVGYHVLTPARANPFATGWFQRQETASDLWHWGGVFAGGFLSGAERIDNAVLGVGPKRTTFPEQAASAGAGSFEWTERTIVRTTETVDHDPLNDASFKGRFAGAITAPTLRAASGDVVVGTDLALPPVVVELPIRPSGIVVYSLPEEPPGVDLRVGHRIDFDARTLTISVTVRAGSRWPESRKDAETGIESWTWTPTYLFPGWEYGGKLPSGLSTALAPATLRPDGSLEIRRFRGDGLPAIPAGLLDLNLPAGTRAASAWGDDHLVGGMRLPSAPGQLPIPASGGHGDVFVGSEHGSPALVLPHGSLSTPVVAVDGVRTRLDESLVLDQWAEASGTSASVVTIAEVDGVFLDVVLTATTTGGMPYAAYHLWDAHSVDGKTREVSFQARFDPALGGDDGGDRFVEPFYTNEPYPVETALGQGVLDYFPGAFVNGWLGSIPAVEMQGGGSGVRHLQLYPNQPNTSIEALRTFGFLLRDHGDVPLDPWAAVADREPVIDSDIAFALENTYAGTIWNDGLVPWTSYFLLDP